MEQDAEQQAFNVLKQRLVEAPILCYPDFSGQYPFRLETDASKIGTGAVLSQRYPDGDHPLGFYSYTLKPKERDWSTTEREAYAIVKALRFFRPILAGQSFTVITDHSSLRYLFGMRDPTGRLARWIMEMQQYTYGVDHRAGKNHQNADAFSRAPIVQALTTQVYQQALITTTTILPSHSAQPSPPTAMHAIQVPPLNQIQQLQEADPVMNGYLIFLTDGTMARVPAEIQPLLIDIDNYTVIDGILYHLWHPEPSIDRPSPRVRLVVPQELRPAILHAHHENILAGHRGIQATYQRLRRNYFWIGMYADCVAWVRSCLTCGHRKKSRRGQAAGLHPIKPPDQPFSTIVIDFLGPLPKTADGNQYLLVINDLLTKYPLAFPCKTNAAQDVADILIPHIFLEYGPPSTILSDQGPHFHNELIAAIDQLFLVNHVFSSGYRPQTAGITERCNQSLLDILAMYVNHHHRDWDRLLPYVLFAFRTLYNPAIKNVPFFLLYGYEPVLPHEMYLLPPHLNQSIADQERNKIATYLNEARKLARDSILATQQATKDQVDANRRQAPNYQPGDLVMAIQPYVPTGGSFKLARLYNGPYKIESYLPGHRTLQLTHVHTAEPRLAHIDNVKRYVAADHLRPTLVPEAPIPQPTPEAELRVIDQLARAAGTAKHVLGAGRARATTEHILGSSSLPPLPDPDAFSPLPDMAGLLSWPLVPPLPPPVPPSAFLSLSLFLS